MIEGVFNIQRFVGKIIKLINELSLYFVKMYKSVFNKHKERVLIVIMLIIAFFSMVGCAKKETDRHKSILINNSNENIEIFYPKYDKYPSETFIKKWEFYMREKHGIDIKLEYTSWNDNISGKLDGYEYIGVDTDDLINKSDKSGFVYLTSYKDLNKLIDASLLYPIENVIEDLCIVPGIDIDLFNTITDNEGHTWAMPLDNRLATDYRIYNKEWLDKAGIGVPQTLFEFISYAKFVANEDPDENGIKDTYIMEYTLNRYSMMKPDGTVISWRQFEDIFRAFGCYGIVQEPIQYNPLKEKYENFIVNEYFIDAMVFIKFMIDEGLIVEIGANRNKVASTYNSYTTPKSGRYGSEAYGYFLTHTNTVRLIEEKYNQTCLGVLVNTDNITNKLKVFNEVAILNIDGHIDFLYGIQDINYVDKGAYYAVLNIEGQSYWDTMIGMSINVKEKRSDFKPVVGEGNQSSYAAGLSNIYQKDDQAIEELRRHFGSELSYYTPFDTYDSRIEEMNLKLSLWTYPMFSSYFLDELSLDDAIALFLRRTGSWWIDELESINRE